jgi:pimeloyl-ACP methyl ester carboxylesterase
LFQLAQRVGCDPASVTSGARLDQLDERPAKEGVCQDVPAPQAALMAITQRPATQEALTEPSCDHPLWKDVPSWFLIGEHDHIIPAALQHYMAKRARAHRTTEIPGASHAITISHPQAVAHQILEAAALPVVA